MTGYIISYQQQDGGNSDSMNVIDTVTSTIITGLLIGATYSISIVATSHTLPSDETTASDITIGNMKLLSRVCMWLLRIYLPRASHHLSDLFSFLLHHGWRHCHSHLLCYTA